MKRKLKLSKLTCLSLFLFLTAFVVNAQDRNITGTILDEEGGPLPGVNVVIKGTTIGAITDMDGNYTMSVPADAVLVTSYVGYLTQEIEVGSQSQIDVSLAPDLLDLEEVVVVGYGFKKKATLTGSVAQVKGDEVLRDKGTSSAALALQGEIPGLTVTRGTSRPGNEEINIKVRGDISVNGGGGSPLILIDGIEVAEWQLSTINSNDIESISVLKDGAAAIYGTKAAGGVIMITTKKGEAGKLKVEYLTDLQLNVPYEMPSASMKEWAGIWLLGGRNDMIDYVDTDGNPQTAAFTGRFFSEDDFQRVVDGTFPLAPDSYLLFGGEHRFEDADYVDYIFGTTLSHRHSVALSGGNDRTTFRTSLGFSNDRSPMELVYDGAKKYNFRTNLDYKVNDVISTDFNISYDYRIIDEPSDGVGEGLQNPNFYPIHNPQGQYYTIWAHHIPLELEEGGRTITNRDLFRIGGSLNLDFNKYIQGLSFRYTGNVSTMNLEKNRRRKKVTKYDWYGNPSTYGPNSEIQVDLDNEFFQNHVIRGNYGRSFGDNNVSLMAGVTWEEEVSDMYYLERKFLLSDDLDALNTGSADTQENKGEADHESLVSYVARLNYDYAGIYLLELTARRDGSSRFHPDYRWKNFMNGSAGIRLSEISAIRDLDIFDNLKLRASWGETGSRAGIGLYDYISTMASGSTYFGASPAIFNTYRIASMTTTERTWERISTTNFGLDFGVMNSRLRGTFEYFIRKNDDMLVSITYPEILGASAPKTNSGAFTTKGYELSLNWRDRIGDLTYNIGLSYWDSESEITRMEGAETIKRGLNNTVEGYPLQSLFVYETDGILETEEEVYDYYEKYGFGSNDAGELDETMTKAGSDVPAYRSPNRLVPGCVIRVDQNGDGLINESDDLVFHGDANPHHNFGISLGLEYKGFDFYAFFQGVGQQYILRTGTLAWPFSKWWRNQNAVWLDNTWTPDNQDADWPMAFYNGSRKNWNYARPNDVNVINARYMRAKVLTLGYTLPSDMLQRINVDRVRLSVTANDLFVISNVNDGLDPEHDKNGTNGSLYPYSYTLVFSLQVGF